MTVSHCLSVCYYAQDNFNTHPVLFAFAASYAI